ncbi:MAG TPA: hypothetical protein VLA58_02045, partial [Chitinophagaceae bacterium]|nr:hypothetical protein [Chitinophagaceae bacterium]
MATPKRITDLSDYTSVLPYASEMFGIYQPLLGWKSKRILNRFSKGLEKDKRSLLQALKEQFSGRVKVSYDGSCEAKITELKPGTLTEGRNILHFDSIVLGKIAELLPPLDAYYDNVWVDLLSDQQFDRIFNETLIPHYSKYYTEYCKRTDNFAGDRGIADRSGTAPDAKTLFVAAFEAQLKYESALAGSLQFLLKSKNFDALKDSFYTSNNREENAIALTNALAATNTEDAYLNLENLNPSDKADIQNVALSPISVVHLFRQYFFELDTFLGTPVEHVWLSPGSNVELIEVSTRRTLIEKSLETSLETIAKAEQSTTNEDEISEAVKE